ncbi:hypothetical protein AAG570_012012 [Ranatra chinensis]|uniref:Protein yellow n=1 Tax=Ranatra chinensis TaxID=642074 RepID=A0ABD0YHK1_9HEMI
MVSMSITPTSAKRPGRVGGRGLFREVFKWSTVEFKYPSEDEKSVALISGKYRPENGLPLGLEVWKPGVGATLATVPLPQLQKKMVATSPILDPYPSWSWHTLDTCNGITSVFRVAVDDCGRLWVLDSGKVDVVTSVKPVCPAQLLIFDLKTDSLVWSYKFPKLQTPHGSLLTNIVVDVKQGKCHDAHAYVSDVFRYGLLVYSLREDKSWRIDHPYFYPDPLATKFNLDGIRFSWTDGIFGIALPPEDVKTGNRSLFFHPLSSFREFSVPTSYLRNETGSEQKDPFRKVGEPRRRSRGHASGSAFDRQGVLFYNLVSKSAVGCWNSKTGVHNPHTQGVVARDPKGLSFPNDLKVDHNPDQGLWVLSNRLHKFLYSTLSPNETNFRVYTGKVKELVKGTPCGPGYVPPPQRKQRRKCQDQ